MITVAWSPASSAGGLRAPEARGHPTRRRLARRLAAAAIGSPDWLFNNVFLKAWKIDDRARSSMADDLAAGRKTGVDYLNGAGALAEDSLRHRCSGQPLPSSLVRR